MYSIHLLNQLIIIFTIHPVDFLLVVCGGVRVRVGKSTDPKSFVRSPTCTIIYLQTTAVSFLRGINHKLQPYQVRR